MTHEEVKNIVSEAVAETLAKLGVESSDHKEMQADFAHLRRWRKSVEQAQGYTFKTVITVIVTGLLGAIWLGVQTLMHK